MRLSSCRDRLRLRGGGCSTSKRDVRVEVASDAKAAAEAIAAEKERREVAGVAKTRGSHRLPIVGGEIDSAAPDVLANARAPVADET